MKRKFRLNRRKAVLYLVAFLFNLWVYNYALPLHLDILTLVNTNTCPACYGQNLCDEIITGQIRLSGSSRWSLYRFLNSKNVFYGDWNNRSIVLKNLGNNKELAELDATICGLSSTDNDCSLKKAIEELDRDYSKEKTDLQGLSEGQLSSRTLSWRKIKEHPRFLDVELLKCSANQKLVDLFIHSALHHPSTPTIQNILTLLLINQEPVFAAAFTPAAGWPFPLYYGSCGRLAVFENIGPSLNSHYRSAWILRAHLAVKLLEMAGRLSKNKFGLALYPTDWSANNFAVDAQRNVFLVDLENIIVVNQTLVRQLKSPGWDTYHTADRFGCTNCFSFSTEDLCTHAETDHNYHGVCGGLLASNPYSPAIPGGLLHSMPRDVLARHPLLPGLIDDCWKSPKTGGRESAAQLILEILRSELEDVDINKIR